MSEHQTVIEGFIKRSFLFVLGGAALRGFLRVVMILFPSVLVLGVIDYGVQFEPALRQGLWALLVLAGAASFLSGFWPLSVFSIKERSKNLSRRFAVSPFRSDDLAIALELMKKEKPNGVSLELRDRFLERMAERLRNVPARRCLPLWAWRKPVVLCTALSFVCGSLWAFFPNQFLPRKIINPFFAVDVDLHVKVEPEEATVPRGGDIEIKITLLSSSLNQPKLFIKGTDDWEAREADHEMGRSQIYAFRSVVEPIYFRVFWNGDWSRKYTITPVEPLTVDEFLIRITPPEYLKRPMLTQSVPEISGLAGSRVEMEARASVPLAHAKVLFSDGRELEMEPLQADRFKTRFLLDRGVSYGFALTSKDSQRAQTDFVYPIHVVEDAPPSVTLLSPDQDLVIGEREKVPLTLDARDDFGVQQVSLIWETREQKRNERRLERFEPTRENVLSTYEWDLALERFPLGEVIRYQIEVRDANVVTGPGVARSPWRLIEITNFDREHVILEKTLEKWRTQAVDLLAGVNTLKSRVESDKPDFPALRTEFNKTAEGSTNLEQNLQHIVNQMERDPLSDYRVWLEHKAMLESLRALNQTAVKEAQSAFQVQNKPAAASHLEQMSSELERMIALSEDLSKTQNAQDVVQAGENVERLGESLLNQLESGNKIDAEMKAQVDRLLSQAMAELGKMVRSLKNMPEELPDDFVNQKAIKNLDVGASQDLLSQIQQAMARGDYQAALKLARQFLETAKKMKEELERAHDSFLESNSATQLARQMAQQTAKLAKIADEERAVLAETQKLESKRMEAFLKAQESLLKQLAERQRRVVAKTIQTVQAHSSDPRLRSGLDPQIPAMQEVATELETLKIRNTMERLDTITNALSLLLTDLKISTAPAGMVNRVSELHSEETAIRDALRQPVQPPSPFSEEDQKQFSALRQRQTDLKSQTQSLKRDIQALARKTASLGLPLMQALSEAAGEMESAGKALSDKNSQAAQRAEENALSKLLEAQASMEGAQGAMGEMGMEQGAGSGGGAPQIRIRGGAPAARGADTGKVKLPRAEDYRPPKEFRDELMEALKEKYPKIYEDIIHKYYKRLVE